MKPKPLNIYISLPISGCNIDDVEARAIFASGVIESKGHLPINPLDFGEGGEKSYWRLPKINHNTRYIGTLTQSGFEANNFLVIEYAAT